VLGARPGLRVPTAARRLEEKTMSTASSCARASRPAARALRVPVPHTRDPFVNTPLLSLGPGADGEERFWISTWNSCVGTLALLVTESGKARPYRFRGKVYGGFYSAVQEDADTLWLCGDLSRVVRLTLSTGAFEEYPTGAPGALVFQGMALDRASGALFAAACPWGGETTAFSFDTRRRRSRRIFTGIAPAHYMRFHFPNGDGTWSFVMHCPGECLVRWDPRNDTVDSFQYRSQLDTEILSGGTTYHLIPDDAGRWYVPGLGWYTPASRAFDSDGPRPAREMTWFARRGNTAWGASCENGAVEVGAWDFAGGAVRALASIPDSQLHNVALSPSGKIVSVNLYGEFFRFDGATGALELSRRLPADSHGAVDCLCRIDRDRLLGTPFITQRFWTVNLRTRKGEDCGRAAPGCGEVLRTWKLGGRIYMAAYGGGELVEYDPERPARFPENPRVVADPPHGMRPVADAEDGRCLYYSCSTEYGTLGSVLTRYDTRSGEARYHVRPLGPQQIVSLRHDRRTRCLLVGTTMHSDCRSCPPSETTCWFARMSGVDLSVLDRAPAPAGTAWCSVLGPLDAGRYLCACGMENPNRVLWFALDPAAFGVTEAAAMSSLPEGRHSIQYAGKPGLFVLRSGPAVELWDMRRPVRLRTLVRNARRYYRIAVEDGDLYLVSPRSITILEGAV
jgi:hypothetical protein